jgi:hypothetical protein
MSILTVGRGEQPNYGVVYSIEAAAKRQTKIDEDKEKFFAKGGVIQRFDSHCKALDNINHMAVMRRMPSTNSRKSHASYLELRA